MIDHHKGVFTIDTPRTCGGFAFPDGDITAGPFRATVRGVPATVWVSSLDGRAIPVSRRLLVSHLTDVQGDGVTYAERARRTVLEWGRGAIVEIGQADVSLALADASRCKVSRFTRLRQAAAASRKSPRG